MTTYANPNGIRALPTLRGVEGMDAEPMQPSRQHRPNAPDQLQIVGLSLVLKLGWRRGCDGRLAVRGGALPQSQDILLAQVWDRSRESALRA